MRAPCDRSRQPSIMQIARRHSKAAAGCPCEPRSRGNLMCNQDHWHEHDAFGFLVDAPEIRALIAEVERQANVGEPAERIERLKPAFARLLSAEQLAAARVHPRRRDEPHGRRHRPVRALSRRGWFTLPLRARRSARARPRPSTTTSRGDSSASTAASSTKRSTGVSTTAETRRARASRSRKSRRSRLASSIRSSRRWTTSTMCVRRRPVRRSRSTCSPTTRPACGGTSSIPRRER